MKYLVILSIIILLAFLAVHYVSKKVKGFFRDFSVNNESQFGRKTKKEQDDVVYQKDNVVVLKGEAGKRNKNESNKAE